MKKKYSEEGISVRDIRSIKKIYIMLLVLLMGVCVFAAMGSTNDVFMQNQECSEYISGWTYIRDDEEEISINKIPIDIKSDKTFTISNTLPEDVSDNTYFAIKSQDQIVTVYIDGRVVYANDYMKQRAFGKYDGRVWLFVPLTREYAGKDISVQIEGIYNVSNGRIDSMYIGNMMGIVYALLKVHGFALAMGLILLVLGCIFLSVFLIGRWSKFRWNNYLYLCYFSIAIAVWLICESGLGQFLCPDSLLLNILRYASIMLAPIPILFYTNEVEKNRFGGEFNLMCWVFIVNILAQTALYATQTCGLSQMVWVTHILILMTFITVLISLYVKYKETGIKSIKNNFEGLIALFVFSAAEAFNYYLMDYTNVGNYVAVGVMIYVIILSHGSTSDRLEQEREKIVAVSQNQAKTNFLARMSHEIRTPMNAIIGMNDMILNENINDDVRRYAINIKNSANVMMALLSDVLDFSKIENGKMEIVNVSYKLFNLLRDVIGITQVTANNKKLKFIYEIDENIPSGYMGDEVRIRQVLLNILNNAVKYTEKGYVKMTFNCETNGFDALFTIKVEDTGIGIKKEDIGKIFDTFERLDSMKNIKVEGFGLGLTITKQLLDLMGGTIEIQSEYGKGSVFTVRLNQKIVDRKPMEPLNEENIVNSSSDRNQIEGKYAGKRILAVDDNVVNLQVVAGLLKPSKARVDGVLSGDKCLSAMARYHYDLILMDHRMPGMDGVETLKYIRGNPVNNGIPVIALTANAVEGAREDFLAEGFDDYISKPISAKKFYTIIDKYLE